MKISITSYAEFDCKEFHKQNEYTDQAHKAKKFD